MTCTAIDVVGTLVRLFGECEKAWRARGNRKWRLIAIAVPHSLCSRMFDDAFTLIVPAMEPEL